MYVQVSPAWKVVSRISTYYSYLQYLQILTRYLQDTYEIPTVTRYLQIPAHTLRVNMGIRRNQHCRYVQVLHVCEGIWGVGICRYMYV